MSRISGTVTNQPTNQDTGPLGRSNNKKFTNLYNFGMKSSPKIVYYYNSMKIIVSS